MLVPRTVERIEVDSTQLKRLRIFHEKVRQLLSVDVVGERVISDGRTGTHWVDISPTVLSREIERRCQKTISAITSSGADLGMTLRTAHQFSLQAAELCTMPEMRLCFDRNLEAASKVVSEERINITPDAILSSRRHFQVVGNPGAGKTTLLRILGHQEATAADGRLPIFVQLSELKAKQPLVDLIHDSCANYGLTLSRKELDQLLRDGRCILLCDGIDEAVIRVSNIGKQLADLAVQHPATQCIVTTREWSALEKSAVFFTVNIQPLTKLQVETFFKNWFSDDVRHTKEILSHLKKNPRLYDLISTPLVATIFAVVKYLGGNLPSSTVEVHQERLRLLLHDWDAVRGVKRDKFSARDKLLFLRKFAYELHVKSSRAASKDEVISSVLWHVGQIHERATAEEFIRELVQHNNMLLQDASGSWGLGHLQYQEFLAALEAKENPNCSLADFVVAGWWTDVLRMYAELTRDISKLIYDVTKRGVRLEDHPDLLRNLYGLLALAPNTERRARTIVDKAWEIHTVVEKSFEAVTDDMLLSGRGKPRGRAQTGK